MMRLAILGALAALLLQPAVAAAHAFPQHAVPGAGAVLAQAPAMVTIRFDAELAPQASTLLVKDGRGVQVSEGAGHVDSHDAATIFTRLTTAARGVYHVYWAVTDRDGHHTRGDYTFTVR